MPTSSRSTIMRPSCRTAGSCPRRPIGARSTLGVVGVVELTALIGYYTMVAMTLNAHEFPLPAGAVPPFEPVAA